MTDDEKPISLDLNNPDDARRFINEALPKALPSKASHAILKNGERIDLMTLSDSQAVQYAWELLPIYQAVFPELVEVHNEH